jgi:hypothetical protein
MVAVRYKYPGENEVVIQSADDYAIEVLPDPVGTTKWQGIGSFTHAPTGEKRLFLTK